MDSEGEVIYLSTLVKLFMSIITFLFIKIFLQVFTAPFFKSSKEGAQTSIYCAVSEEVEGVSGKYFSDCKIRPLKPHALNDDQAEKLWKISAEMVGLKDD